VPETEERLLSRGEQRVMVNRCECDALAAFAGQGIVEGEEQKLVIWNPPQSQLE
jgi:hypothetical protein